MEGIISRPSWVSLTAPPNTLMGALIPEEEVKAKKFAFQHKLTLFLVSVLIPLQKQNSILLTMIRGS